MPVIPHEAVAYLADKKLKTAWNWSRIYAAEHNTAFTVAKIMEQDILGAIHEQVITAVAEGQTFHSFKRDLINRLGESGWGNYEEVDKDTGEVISRLSDRRLKKVYDTNVTQAYHAGAWERFQKSKKAFPYLRYRLGPSRVHRDQHKAWENMVLPVEKLGISKSPKIEYHNWKNEVTGRTHKVPKGIHPGFEYNVGMHRQQKHLDLLADKIEAVAQHSPIRAKNTLTRLSAHALFRENARLLALQVLLNGEKVAFVGDELGVASTKLARAKQADKLLREIQGKPLANAATGLDFVVGKKSRKKLGDNAHLSEVEHLAIAKLSELVKNAVVIERHADDQHANPNVRGILRLFALMQVNSRGAGVEDYGVKMTVKDYLLENGETRLNLHAIEVYRLHP